MTIVSFPYKRIVVVGATGCGKSTLADRLAQCLTLDMIELDALYWKPGWNESPRDEFREKVDKVTLSPRWIVAGNYGLVRDIVWARAEALIWLDYPFLVTFTRLVSRIYTRWRTKELLWGTNTEPLWIHFKLWSKDSLINWLVQSYWRHKRLYPVLFRQPEFSHMEILRFHNPKETEEWYQKLSIWKE